MILRLIERTDRIAHIPRILYHWRAHPGSTAGGDAKPYAYVAARNAIAAHLERTGIDAEVEFGPPGPVPRRASGRSVDERRSRARRRGRSTGSPRPPAPGCHSPTPPGASCSPRPQTRARGRARRAHAPPASPTTRITTIPTDPATDARTALAAAADAATAEHLLLMQTPAVGLTHDWLTRLIGYSDQPGIAAAGPVVLAPDGRIQQAGIALPEGIPLHLLHGSSVLDGQLLRLRNLGLQRQRGERGAGHPPRHLPAARRPATRSSETSP